MTRKWSFHQKSDIQQGGLQYANNHMIKCGMKSMMVRVSLVSVYYATVCHIYRKYRKTMCMTKHCLVLGDQKEGKGRRWRKTLTQKFPTDVSIRHHPDILRWSRPYGTVGFVLLTIKLIHSVQASFPITLACHWLEEEEDKRSLRSITMEF